MASLHARVETVKSTVSSVTTCTPATTVILKDLLLPKDAGNATESGVVPAKGGRVAKPKTTSTSKAPAKKAKASNDSGDGELPAKEKAVLATHVINVTIKSLGESTKQPPSTPSRKDRNGELSKTAALRRSLSSPMTPLRPRSLNRVSTSPVATTKPKRPPPSSISNGCLCTVECARVAFSCLRALQNSGIITLPELQLETGMSSFIGKLIGLDMMEQATKELRILKRRLDSLSASDSKRKGKAASSEPAPPARTVVELLDFHVGELSAPALNLVITTQLQTLRVLSKMKRPSSIEDALPYLQETHTASPLNLLLLLSSQKGGNDQAKVARQLENLSQLVLSLTPSVSSSDDATALEARLSIGPVHALQMQTLGLLSRLHWWKLADHKGDVDKDILSPLSRCLTAYIRRTGANNNSSYKYCLKAFTSIYTEIGSQRRQPKNSSKSPLAAIYQALATISRECHKLDEAIAWAEKLRACLDPNEDSISKQCAVAAQLLAYQLKEPWTHINDDSLLSQVLGGVQGPLRGDSAELDELLVNLSMVRKASMSILLGQVVDDKDHKYQPPASTKELLESFILQLPRFCLRWLGKPPTATSATKDFLRFDQRRQLLLKSIQQILDSALMQTKSKVEEQRISWELMESGLHDTLTLLEYVGDIPLSDHSTSYHVKASHLYYLQHKCLYQQSGGVAKDIGPSLRALRHSISCIKDRPCKERAKGQLIMKLERMAELSRASGKREDVLGAFQMIRDSLVDDGVLRGIAQAMGTISLTVAWSLNDESGTLSRALESMAKVEPVWMDWTLHLEETERAAALEHRLQFILFGMNKKAAPVELSDTTVTALLQLYSRERFPVRRFRTLVRLYANNMGNAEDLSTIQSQADAAVDSLECGGHGEDQKLTSYLPHLKSLYSSLKGLARTDLQGNLVRGSLSNWRSMLQACNDKHDLDRHIDNSMELLGHLRSMADAAHLKGDDNLVLEVLQLAAEITRIGFEPSGAERINIDAALALQFVKLGRLSQADQTLRQSYERFQDGVEVPYEIRSTFHLAYAEYLLAIGKLNEANVHLMQAREAMPAEQSATASKAGSKWLVAHACLLHSLVAFRHGEAQKSLLFMRNSVRMLFHDWTRLEQRTSATALGRSTASLRDTNDDDDDTAVALSASDAISDDLVSGPEVWRLVYPLLRSLLELSKIYAHLGMFQETTYYAEQAQKVARSTGSNIYIAQSAAWMAAILTRANKLESVPNLAAEARSLLQQDQGSCVSLSLVAQLSNVYHELADFETETDLLEIAEAMLRKMSNHEKSGTNTTITDVDGLEARMSKLSIKEKAPKPIRKTKANTTRTKKAATTKPKSDTAVVKVLETEDICLTTFRSSILIQKANLMISTSDWSSAIDVLTQVKGLPKLSHTVPLEMIATASSLIGLSMDQMAKDPVFSVVQDSTLSFPSVCIPSSDRPSDRVSLPRTTPPKKDRAITSTQPRDYSREPSPDYLENLKHARDYLLEAHSIAAVTGSGSLVHRILGMLQTVVILVSAASSTKRCPIAYPGYATCSMELARNLTWRRERKALLLEPSTVISAEWPVADRLSEPRRSSLDGLVDINRLQRDYIDIIPQSWSVISISVSENKHDLCISKLQAGQSPFVIRLPLERASSRDADSEVFNFQQGRSELDEIIKLANETCHDSRDFSVKGAKTAWWADREALDNRLRDFLENMEQIWLGGFKGIFSQHTRKPDLLARFQKSFQDVLDKYLPSRRQVRGKRSKATGGKVTLDPRILDLFIGLGDATQTDVDFDEALTDLLYFVVDILQFHGERNAYDEVDFDSMVVETFDALHSYHSAAKEESGQEGTSHTLLVLDKALHIFPWESLPCMKGHAVSRVPNLACLRRLILERTSAVVERTEDVQDGNQSTVDGHTVSFESGSYILNPGADLKTTQTTFEKPLSSLPRSWKGVVSRTPSESEFEAGLSSADILLYFGHGSGAQYIRGRTIRKLEKCRATVLLMGCSSASLPEVGDFECQGPVWNYMMAGSPAVVGTLWDVTDRDIDRFAGRALEEWGLVQKGTFVEEATTRKGKAKAGGAGVDGGRTKKMTRTRAADDEERSTDREAGHVSLPEAVARAREACRFRYLTAAAVCVYGIPVYVKK